MVALARESFQVTGGRDHLSAADRDHLRFEQRRGMLRNILSAQAPGLAAKHADRVLTKLLACAGVPRRDIATWVLHPGGRMVLLAMQERIGLSEHDLHWSGKATPMVVSASPAIP